MPEAAVLHPISMASQNLLAPRMLLRDIAATTLEGIAVHLSDFRGRRNLVLIFAGTDAEESRLLQELRHTPAVLQEEESVVVTVADPDRAIRSWYGALAPDGTPAAALYVADRYGEIFFSAHPGRGRALPSAAEVLDWLRFINSQCPE